MTSKVCSTCKIEKTLNEFGNRSKVINGSKVMTKKCFCKACDYIKQKTYKEKNKSRLSERDSKYYLENKDHFDKKSKKWRTENKEKISEDKKEYYQKNKEDILEKRKEYYQNIKTEKSL